jgi:hypothetical protein
MKGNSIIAQYESEQGCMAQRGEERKAWVLRISSGGNVASEMHMQRLDLHAGAVTLRT